MNMYFLMSSTDKTVFGQWKLLLYLVLTSQLTQVLHISIRAKPRPFLKRECTYFFAYLDFMLSLSGTIF